MSAAFSYMLKKIFFVLIIIASVSINNSFATYGQYTGCISANTQYIYYTPDGTYNGMLNYNWDRISPQGQRILKSNTYCSVVSNTNCRINKNASNAVTGKLTTFYFYNCPIDDYIPIALIAVSGFGMFILRKKSLILISLT